MQGSLNKSKRGIHSPNKNDGKLSAEEAVKSFDYFCKPSPKTIFHGNDD